MNSKPHSKPQSQTPVADHSFTIGDLHASYAAGLSVASVIDEVLRRIAVVDDPGIFIALFERAAILLQAENIGAMDLDSKPLWGIPFVIKDNIDAAGYATTAACPAYAYDAGANAVCLERLMAAGAILVGKTNLDQFATGLVGTRTPFPVPRNALDPNIVPGGSSSGSAVAVAQAIVSFSLGTDTAGSGRVPAALNGIVGLKPSLGSVSCRGVVPACKTIDTVSVFARSIDDAWCVYKQLAAFDEHDPYSRRLPAGSLPVTPPAFTVAVPDVPSRKFFGDEKQAASFEASLQALRDMGAEITEVNFAPFYAIADLLYQGPWVAERYLVAGPLLQDDPEAVVPVTAAIIGAAESFSAPDVFRAQYQLKELKRRTDAVMDAVDLICVPSIPAFCSLDNVRDDPVGANAQLGTYTNFVNLLDMCGITIPTAPRVDGRPGSITLLSGTGRDAFITSIARTFMSPDTVVEFGKAQPDEMNVAAVGAHMSGLPLNHELTGLGARFLRKAFTAEEYKLYALAGGPPARPGMIRDKNGSRIELEIWAMPGKNFGAFMSRIPSPLGMGTIFLDDGEKVTGFLCESAGLVGALDITRFGGWRTYIQRDE